MTNNQIQFAKLSEDRRHYQVVEQETGRHNIAQENVARQGVGAQYAAVAESRRHAMESEAISRSQLAESMRHNQETERLTGEKQASEDVLRQAQAYAQRITADARKDEISLSQKQLEEAIRHNLVQEGISKTEADAAAKRAAAQSDLVTSQKVENYTSGIKNLTGSVRDIASAGSDLADAISKVVGMVGF